MARLLHLAPHPDDEILGAGGTLIRLAEAGWTVVNLACSLGRPDQAYRRGVELAEACRIAGFALRHTTTPIGISVSDDLVQAEAELADEIRSAIDDVRPDLIVGPSPHDAHHGHEVVGRATVRALTALPVRPPWWMWTLWGAAPLPSLLVPLSGGVVQRASRALAAHAGELARNDYAALLDARARANAVLGAERVFGWGAVAIDAHEADILTEVLPADGEQWPLGAPRIVDPRDAVAPAQPRGIDLGAWLRSPSPRAALVATSRTRNGDASEGTASQANP